MHRKCGLLYFPSIESNYTEIYENCFYPHYQKVNYILTKELTEINDFFFLVQTNKKNKIKC